MNEQLAANTVIDFITRNWALLSSLCTVTVLVVTPWMILRKYVRITFNLMRDTPPPLSMGPRDFIRQQGEEVTFRAFDGLSLRGMFLFSNAEVPRNRMIVFAHEFASDRFSCARYCRPLLDAGYDVFSFDFRGHGNSSHEQGYQPRQWASDRELDDMMGAIAYAEDWLERHGRLRELGLFGISRGACAGIMAAANNPSIKAIIADGAFSTDTIIEYLMRRWAGTFAKVRFVYENHPPAMWRFLRWLTFMECRRKLHCRFPSVRKAVARMMPRPLLFVHGERDSYVPVEQTQLLYALASQPKYLWIVAKAKHNQSVIIQPKQYATRTVAFFDRFLAGADTTDNIFDLGSLSDLTSPIAPEARPRPKRSARASTNR